MNYYIMPRGMEKSPRLIYTQGGRGPKLLREWEQLTLNTHFLLRGQYGGKI